MRESPEPEILRTIHTARDTADRLQPDALVRAARFVTGLVRDLAAAQG